MGFQTRDNELATAMRTQIEWTSFTVLNPLQRYLSLRHLVLWINGRRIDRLITKEIDKRLQQDSKSQQSTSIIDMLLTNLGPNPGVEGRTEQVKARVIPQIRAFLFGGNDTTSSTLLYCYYMLAEHPQVLDKVLAEHNEVFGPDAALTQDLIHHDPFLLNKLPYTTAVMKEVLRLFPPAASVRIGRPGATITDDDGNIYPIEGCNVLTLTLAIHHNPKYWPEPEAFKPERWLVEPGHELYPVKGAWRPFHHGPKNCLGQPLAMLELKICLAMTLRDFCITPAYHQWDSMHSKAGDKSRIRTVYGHRAYQAEMGGGGAHPADGFPVQVTLRKT
jgi:sterigmatocystin biosynthesis cytochrome P450 monooxygenase